MVWSVDQCIALKRELPVFNVLAQSNTILESSLLNEYLNYYFFSRSVEFNSSHYSAGITQVNVHSQKNANESIGLFTQYWRAKQEKGTVFVCHGLFDHAGLFGHLISFLLDNHFSVIIFDFPAHGLSDGDERLVRNFDEYGDLLHQFVEMYRRDLTPPFFAAGQSTGGAAISNYIFSSHYDGIFEKVVMFAPLLKCAQWNAVVCSHALLKNIVNFVPRSFKQNSHDVTFCHFLQNLDPLQTRSISVQWIGAMRSWVKSFQSYPPVSIPAMVIQGDQDTTVDWQSNLAMIQNAFPHAQVNIIHGAMHHLVNEEEANREKMFNLIRDFLA